MVYHFCKIIDAILEDISVAEIIVWCLTTNLKSTIFQCSTYNSSAERVNKFKVAPNMADATNLKKKGPLPTQVGKK